MEDSSSSSETEFGAPSYTSTQVNHQNYAMKKNKYSDTTSSSEEEQRNTIPQFNQEKEVDSSEEESSAEETGAHSTKDKNNASDSEESSDEDIDVPGIQNANLDNSLRSKLLNIKAPPDTSSEESSGDDEVQAPVIKQRISEDSSDSEDVEQNVNFMKPTGQMSNQLTSFRAPVLERSVRDVHNFSDTSSSDDEERPIPIEVPVQEVASSSDSESDNDQTLPSNDNNMVKPKSTGTKLLQEKFENRKRVGFDNGLLNAEDITSDDEIWLIQCPKSMNPSVLKKQNINLRGNGEIRVEEDGKMKRYKSTASSDFKKAIHCVLPSSAAQEFKIVGLPVTGTVLFQEHIHVPKLKLPALKDVNPFPLPSGLKVRHPLLGADFREHLKTAQASLQRKSKQRSKEKKSNASILSTGICDKHADSSSPSKTVRKKKKDSKHDRSHEFNVPSADAKQDVNNSSFGFANKNGHFDSNFKGKRELSESPSERGGKFDEKRRKSKIDFDKKHLGVNGNFDEAMPESRKRKLQVEECELSLSVPKKKKKKSK